jgi:hypothetical protein
MTPVVDPMVAIAELAALRAQSAPSFDPVRLHYLEAMAWRTQAHQGTTRRLLDAKLATALRDYQDRAAKAQALPVQSLAPRLPSPLAELTRQLAQQQLTDGASDDAARGAGLDKLRELKSVRNFRATWSQLSLDRQMAQALAQAPEKAGPLNSQQLVLRALSVMRTLSPDYFQHFMSYANSLLWLEQADSKSAVKSTVESNGAKKPKATRTRAR